MKILKDPRYQFVSILLLFFVLNLIQSYFTNLFEDEAYYYVWSKDLAFGYFDHPPMVALWAAIGRLLAPGELGVRLLSTLGFSGMLWLLWLTVDVKKKWDHVFLFFTVVISMVFWQVFGFIMTPDTPLLFFSALFLFAYKRFLNHESLVNILLLGFSMAAMLYSKYHGILIIAFVVLSHWKLLKSPRFWLASLIGVIIFLPHLYWQYENGFPSFLYHLKERNKKPYSVYKTFIHLVNMIAVVGITFPVVYKAFFKQETVGDFQRSLKYIVYGFFVFFLIGSINTEPQAQWVVHIILPLTLLTFPYFIKHERARYWLKTLTGIQLAIILILRLFFAVPEISPVVLEPHVSDQWIPDLHKNTKGKPIVFVNSYRNASLYNFYTGIKTHSYSILKGRQSQYNLVDFEEKMQGEDVYSTTGYVKNQEKLTMKYSSYLYGKEIPNYQTFEKVQCLIKFNELTLNAGINEIEFELINTYDKNISFDDVTFYGVFQGPKNKLLTKVQLEIIDLKEIKSKDSRVFKAAFEAPEIIDNEQVTFRIALEFYNLLEGFQGNKINVNIMNQGIKE